MASSPVHRRRYGLRRDTAEAHAALDTLVGPLDAVAAYVRYLRGVGAFRAAVEPLAAMWDWKTTAIWPLIAADMDDLGLLPAPPPAVTAPGCLSGQLGFAYVIEGSALGAQVLRRQVANLGFDPACGARHLAAQTAEPARWRGFCAHLEAARCFDPGTAAAAAVDCFAIARRAFEAVDAG